MAGVTGTGQYQARLLARSRLSDDTYQVDLDRPAGFEFAPGQGIRLSRNGLQREYTLVNGPADDRLSLCVQVVQKGPFSPLLARLDIGSKLSFSGPHGYFTFQSSQPAVFVATGTGIAPFVSMARPQRLHSPAWGLDLEQSALPAAHAVSRKQVCRLRHPGVRRSGLEIPGDA